jgi:hypothetical protein
VPGSDLLGSPRVLFLFCKLFFPLLITKIRVLSV